MLRQIVHEVEQSLLPPPHIHHCCALQLLQGSSHHPNDPTCVEPTFMCPTPILLPILRIPSVSWSQQPWAGYSLLLPASRLPWPACPPQPASRPGSARTRHPRAGAASPGLAGRPGRRPGRTGTGAAGWRCTALAGSCTVLYCTACPLSRRD